MCIAMTLVENMQISGDSSTILRSKRLNIPVNKAVLVEYFHC